MTVMHRGKTRSWLFVVAAFVLIASMLAVTSGVAYRQRHSQEHANAIVQNAMASTRLVERIDHDFDHQRLLLDAHIFERDAVTMQRIEAGLSELRADYAHAARAHDPLAELLAEAVAWQKLEQHVAAIEKPVAETLALSRSNQDVAARGALQALEGAFSEIDRDEADLVRINRAAADEALARAAGLQRASTVLSSTLALLVVGLTLLIGVWTIRLVRQREEESGRYASLLEDRNRELDAFAGRVAHDLRGPLMTISTAATTLGQRAPEHGGSVAILGRGVARMEALIENLLMLSRVGAHAHKGVGDPASVVAELGEDLRPRLEADNAALRVDVESAKVQCAEGLLRQALANLADNAVKYRRAGASAVTEIRGRVVGPWYELSVADQGIGMSPDETRQAFDPFYRAVRARSMQGTGLGLSIVKRVVEASGGSVSAESELGVGTTFTILLPMADGTTQAIEP
jgi:signal transduction histidine kinase